METLTILGVPIPPSRVAATCILPPRSEGYSPEFQQATWDSLAHVIDGAVGRVVGDPSAVRSVAAELFAENILRGKGLFCASCMKFQALSPVDTDAFAVLVYIINARAPVIGYLLLKRLLCRFAEAFHQKHEEELHTVTKFMVHLANQLVTDFTIAADLLYFLLKDGINNHVKIAVQLFKELDLSKDFSSCRKFCNGLFKNFRKVLRERKVDKSLLLLIKDLLKNWNAKCQECLAIRPELDWVKPDCRHTHFLRQEYAVDRGVTFDIFKPDLLFLDREMAYEFFRRDVLSEGYWNFMDTELSDTRNLLELRRIIFPWFYRQIKDVGEVGRQLLQKIELGGEMQLCWLVVEYCYKEETVTTLAEFLCTSDKLYREKFRICFFRMWLMAPGLQEHHLGHVAELFAALIAKDLLPWNVLSFIQLTLQDCTPASWYFVERLFLAFVTHLTREGIVKKLLDPALQDVYEALFPKDDLRNRSFAIDIFKSIGMGYVPRRTLIQRYRSNAAAVLPSTIPIETQMVDASLVQ